MTSKDSSCDPIFGTKPVLEALRSGGNIDKILIKKGANTPVIQEIQAAAMDRGIPCQVVPEIKLNRTTSQNHQGVIAYMSPIELLELEPFCTALMEKKSAPLLLVLDAITDVRNIGAILRSAECMGVDGVIIPEQGSGRMGSGTMKASAGAMAVIPVVRVKHIADALYFLQASGFRMIGASEKGSVPIWEADFTGALAIVMGSEERGLSKPALRICDELAHIPMQGRIDSLNVSVAAGLFLYERQRQMNPTTPPIPTES